MEPILNENEMAMVMETMRNTGKKQLPAQSIGLLGMEHRIKKILPVLDKYTYQFGEEIEKLLTKERKCIARVEIQPSEILSVSSIRKIVEEKNARCLLKTEPGNYPVVLLIEPKVIFDMIDRQYGGGKLSNKSAERDLSFLEQRITTKLAKKITEHWNDLLQSALGSILGLSHISTKLEPELFLQEHPTAVKVSLHIESAPIQGNITFIIPGIVFEAAPLHGMPKKKGNNWQQELAESIQQINVPVVVELGQAAMDVSSLLHLTPGQIIRLDHSIQDPLDVLIDGSKSLICQPNFQQEHIRLNIISWENRGE